MYGTHACSLVGLNECSECKGEIRSCLTLTADVAGPKSELTVSLDKRIRATCDTARRQTGVCRLLFSSH
jgi:hypothetical protein